MRLCDTCRVRCRCFTCDGKDKDGLCKGICILDDILKNGKCSSYVDKEIR